MKQVERHAQPLFGNAIGLFIALWAIDHYEWLMTDQREFIVMACGTICIHILMGIRPIARAISARYFKWLLPEEPK